MSNENTYRDCKCKPDEIPQNADYIHNSSTPAHCCDNDKCECHHPLRLWAIKYEVSGVAKFSGVAVVQAKDLCNAQYVFIQNSKFNGFREYIHIICIEELYPNPEPVLLLEDSAAIINHSDLKSYPFLLKSDYEHNIQNISDNVIEAVEDYIEHNPIQQVQSDWNETDETSKAYILNKPEIPDAQVQADWAETDESSKAFIQNKPTIPEAQVNADWESESGKSQILNKPTDLVHTSDIEGLLRNDGSVYTGKYLEQVQDLDNFQASEGKIVQYIGETNSKYTNGYIYKKVGTQTIIPAGTKYIRITDNSGELAKVGIPNGDYYKIEDNADPVAGNIMWYYCYLSDNGAIPIRTTVVDNVEGKVIDIGCYGYADYKFRKVYNITKVDSRGHVKIENPYDNNSVVQFEDGYNATVIGQYGGVESLFQREDIEIYESVYGIRIYKSKSYPAYLLPLEYYNGIYRVIAGWTNTYPHIGSFSNKTSTGTIVLNDEWQQWDVQPREDTSHYVTDSEIGWIEH